MKSQLRLLEYWDHMWDVNEHAFRMGVDTLTIDIEDIYFLIGLSLCGSPVSLTGRRGGGEHMDYYVRHHYVPGNEKHIGKVAIRDFWDLSL
jgi:hypothetical protein